jgi:hypothetical protein
MIRMKIHVDCDPLLKLKMVFLKCHQPEPKAVSRNEWYLRYLSNVSWLKGVINKEITRTWLPD